MPKLVSPVVQRFRTVGLLSSLGLISLVTIAFLGGCGSTSKSTSEPNVGVNEGVNEGAIDTPVDPLSEELQSVELQSGQTWKISETGVGPIQFGMTLEAVRSGLSPNLSLVPEPNVLVDWDSMALQEEGEVLLYILYPAGTVLTDSATVNLLMVVDPRYTTAEGIGPGSPIVAAQEVYGQATLSYNTDDESREYVRFTQAPTYLGFRTTGSPDQWVGRYSNSADGTYYETQDFDPAGIIRFILVDGFSENPDGTFPAPSATSRDSELNCNTAVTTLDINNCSKKTYETTDITLNKVYQQVQTNLSSADLDQLQGAQEAWLNFRDAHCSQSSQAFVGGTAYPTFLFGCLTHVTEERIGYLRQELGIFPEADRTYSDLGLVTVNGQGVDCRNPVGTPVVNYCAQLSYEQSDRALNEVYQTLSSRLSEASKAALTEAELAWLEYRDRHCVFATRAAIGGTGYEAYRNNCLEDLTRDRTEELKIQLDR